MTDTLADPRTILTRPRALALISACSPVSGEIYLVGNDGKTFCVTRVDGMSLAEARTTLARTAKGESDNSILLVRYSDKSYNSNFYQFAGIDFAQAKQALSQFIELRESKRDSLVAFSEVHTPGIADTSCLITLRSYNTYGEAQEFRLDWLTLEGAETVLRDWLKKRPHHKTVSPGAGVTLAPLVGATKNVHVAGLTFSQAQCILESHKPAQTEVRMKPGFLWLYSEDINGGKFMTAVDGLTLDEATALLKSKVDTNTPDYEQDGALLGYVTVYGIQSAYVKGLTSKQALDILRSV